MCVEQSSEKLSIPGLVKGGRVRETAGEVAARSSYLLLQDSALRPTHYFRRVLRRSANNAMDATRDGKSA
jgi:hypothetical protein